MHGLSQEEEENRNISKTEEDLDIDRKLDLLVVSEDRMNHCRKCDYKSDYPSWVRRHAELHLDLEFSCSICSEIDEECDF